MWQCPEVLLDGRHGRRRALDFFPRHVLLDVAMRPTPTQHGALSLLKAVSGRTIRDCERVGHSHRRRAASSALVSRSRAMPAPTGRTGQRSAVQAVPALFCARHYAFFPAYAPSAWSAVRAPAHLRRAVPTRRSAFPCLRVITRVLPNAKKQMAANFVRCPRDRGESVKGGHAPLSQKDSSNRESRRDLRFPARSAGGSRRGACPVNSSTAQHQDDRAPPFGTPWSSGGRGIRTPGPFRVSGFQDHRLKPLGHPSVDGIVPPDDAPPGARRYSGFGRASSIACACAAAALSGSTSIAISNCSAAAGKSPLFR